MNLETQRLTITQFRPGMAQSVHLQSLDQETGKAMDQREQILLSLMGRRVHVVIDRPIGYLHGDILYPVNYGYLPGILAGDGEEQDAYVLGVPEPVAVFDGRVIGVIRRHNDCEDKLVVAPEGMTFRREEIAEAVRFQEQFFDSTVETLSGC